MFGFTTRYGRDQSDPLQTRKSAAEWFRNLPALDVIGRQEQVIRELSRLRHTRPAFDLDRVAAIVFLDGALAVDQRRVFTWYLENLNGSAKLANRFRQAALDVSHGFIFAYHAGLEAASTRQGDRRWRACLPRLTARLIHFHGVDNLVRLFRGDRAIPATWQQIHRLFVRACDLRCESSVPTLPGEGPLAIQGTVEQEYLHTLLQDLLDTGNLTPAELDWASSKLHGWSKHLRLEPEAPEAGGFYVDLAGAAGLARVNGSAEGAKIGYLDSTPLMLAIEHSIAALREPGPDGGTRPDVVKQQRIAILEKIRPVFSPSRHADLRRHARVAVDLPVDIRVGLSRITRALASPEPPQRANAAAQSPATSAATDPACTGRIAILHPPAANAEEIELLPIAGDPRSADAHIEPAAQTPAADDTESHPQWRVNDRSATGWRISAPGDLGQSLALGALVAMSSADGGEWMLGVVSRLSKRPRNEIEAGMSLIATRVVPVTLFGRRQAQADMSVVVDGIDVSTRGARFDGLYLMPPARLGTRLAMRTLIIPTSEYFEGRSVILSTANSNYSVTLGAVIDQHADWSWTTMHVAGKSPRLD
jgi:predicted secreted protein